MFVFLVPMRENNEIYVTYGSHTPTNLAITLNSLSVLESWKAKNYIILIVTNKNLNKHFTLFCLPNLDHDYIIVQNIIFVGLDTVNL